MRVALIGLVLLAVPSCGDSTSANTEEVVPPSTPSEPAAASAAEEPSLKEHMQGHFTAITEIERAIVAGDLGAAKDRAKWLAEHQPHDATEAWDTHLEAVSAAATALTSASDLAEAAVLAAKLGNECAACHLSTTAITTFAHEDLPNEFSDNKSMMRRHQWAADRLWEGLIGPSQSSWQEGAEVLAKAPFVPKVKLPPGQLEKVEAFATKVNKLGEQAASEEDLEARVGLYAELLATCSGCHGIARNK